MPVTSRLRRILLTSAATTLAACASLSSTTQIDPDTSFRMHPSSDRQAVIAVKVTGDVCALGMGYESNAKAKPDFSIRR
jgi:outer membrane lipopolysaccharide assembly protein LptE/RlpB